MKLHLIDDLMSLLMPERCHICGCLLGEEMRYVCHDCLRGLPREGMPMPGESSRMDHLIPSVLSMRGAGAWLAYNPRGASGVLIHDIKYRGCHRLGHYLGRMAALETLPGGFLNNIDYIVPVPIHITRRLQRGYNQSEEIARGMGEVLKVPVVDALTCKRHRSQTLVGSVKRLTNVEGIYRLRRRHGLPEGYPIEVLLVDDVCTTGSTLVSAARALETALPGIRLRLFALALTRRT